MLTVSFPPAAVHNRKARRAEAPVLYYYVYHPRNESRITTPQCVAFSVCLLDDNAMFDAADLIALPGLVPGASRGVPKRDTARESVPAGERAAGDGGVLNQNLCHVIGACAMGGHNVALAMSNGELCHANMSKPRTAAPEPVPTEDKRWPHWTSWPTRHGKVVSLQFDPAHDALVTIEVRADLTASVADFCRASDQEQPDAVVPRVQVTRRLIMRKEIRHTHSAALLEYSANFSNFKRRTNNAVHSHTKQRVLCSAISFSTHVAMHPLAICATVVDWLLLGLISMGVAAVLGGNRTSLTWYFTKCFYSSSAYHRHGRTASDHSRGRSSIPGQISPSGRLVQQGEENRYEGRQGRRSE